MASPRTPPTEHSDRECSRENCSRRARRHHVHDSPVQCSEEEGNLPAALFRQDVCQEGGAFNFEIISLIKGYSENSGPGEQRATGSSTLVKGPKNVIVDTGNPSEKDKLLKALDEKGHLPPEEIDFVVCTHGHSDHVGNLNLFPDATFIVSYDVSKKDQYIVHQFKHGVVYKIHEDVEVWPTPGHTDSDVSVIVKNTRHGTVAITGDLFEKAADLAREDLWKAYSEHEELQRDNREKILGIADYIVPGHGAMFRNPRK
ncbi:metallo-beta-lactamase domain-containing protein 1-like [Dendronephthya gigantea]|uniref:metallo-beta-lactamase domain-containing protein 1-like n=1 Tax=Dendronephthya gigantea TaxID=151771 RepID=UPI00106D7BB1|nr:metallo-beta-lactamase domain-containing protein 1-like [Dendronephthya gigantea]